MDKVYSCKYIDKYIDTVIGGGSTRGPIIFQMNSEDSREGMPWFGISSLVVVDISDDGLAIGLRNAFNGAIYYRVPLDEFLLMRPQLFRRVEGFGEILDNRFLFHLGILRENALNEFKYMVQYWCSEGVQKVLRSEDLEAGSEGYSYMLMANILGRNFNEIRE